jgi:hypothetical protein
MVTVNECPRLEKSPQNYFVLHYLDFSKNLASNDPSKFGITRAV